MRRFIYYVIQYSNRWIQKYSLKKTQRDDLKMNFKKQLKAIENYTKEDCLKNHDFGIDNGYRHPRITNYTDNELKVLHEAVSDKIMELF